ncbi:MAG: Hsp20 family protein [Candidatus Pacebacteria bacterium]|jgi:molecular chaperone IbpA|nr:Hsp20 family protein [Candidatus Paceibacterota bacterium]
MVTLAHHTPFTAGDLERFMGLSVGFDRMFNRLMDSPNSTQDSGFPPYNIRKENDYSYVIEVALAGFSETDIEVEVKDGIITVRSKEDKGTDTTQYVHRGIARRSFSKSWTLSDDIVIKGAEFNNGLLNISLEKVVPEEKKPRLIPITKLISK